MYSDILSLPNLLAIQRAVIAHYRQDPERQEELKKLFPLLFKKALTAQSDEYSTMS